tara:strand:+ start:82 stop:519 length:438 start_codon:yes stop_codon:yes gene_type:complete
VKIENRMSLTRKVRFAIKGRRKRFVDDGEDEISARETGRVPRVSKLMALAIRYDGLLRDGTVQNQTELAHLAQVTQPRMTQIMNLLHLSPLIQEEILMLPAQERGRDRITERDLRPLTRVHSWEVQLYRWNNMKHCLKPTHDLDR